MTQLRQASKQSGKTFMGLVVGLIIGLAIAVVVALYITRGPKPLASKAIPPATDMSSAQPSGNAANTPRKDSSNLLGPAKSTAAPSTSDVEEEGQFDDSRIIELLREEGSKAIKKATPSTHTPSAPNARSSTPADAANTGYYLQVGAYKTETGAEQQRAHLALQGFESKVSQRSSGNVTYYRVRLGPFAKLDEANRARQRLTEASINAIVIRFQKQAS